MKKTPLYDEHLKLNARMTEFGGWEMPVQYSSIIAEHNAVRLSCGMFDASHMGEFIVSGSNAVKFLDRMTLANSGAIEAGRAKYSMLLNEHGGVIDDIIIYRRQDDFFVVVNAGNIDKDFNWLKKNLMADGHVAKENPALPKKDAAQTKEMPAKQDASAFFNDVKLDNISDSVALVAVQGPKAEKIMQELVNDDLSKMKYFSFISGNWKDMSPKMSIIARTGYTGEDGFEVFISSDQVKDLWTKLLALGVTPCGLGARDTLRLEACMPLHGHEITDDITPLEADLERAIYWDKEFIGKEALLMQKRVGLSKFQIAFILSEGIPRPHCDIFSGMNKVGSATSGTFSPTLRKGIGLGYVSKQLNLGDKIAVIVHNQQKIAEIVKKPFYKRKK